MNRRGELERAISRARIGAAPYALYTQLLRRAGNGTGEIDAGRYAPKLGTLARQAKMSERTAYRALWELRRHGWFTRYPGDQHRVSGCLAMGQDCDCAGQAPTCQRPGCGNPLTGKRGDARYCSDRCGKAARRSAATDISPDMSGLRGGNVRPIWRTFSDSSPDKPQVTEPETARADKENSNESEVREMGTENQSVPEPAVWTAEQLAVGREFARLMEASGSDPWR